MKSSSYPIHIRFNDLDSYGHVNNAVYLTYFEEGRKLYFQDKLRVKWDWESEGILLAHHEINYKLPLLLEDEAVIELWISNVGTKSFEVSYRILKREGELWQECTTGKSVAVCFDYSSKKTIPVPEAWRSVFAEEV